MNPAADDLENADIETSSEDYARRFSGALGSWFLRVQEDATLRMLAGHPGASILDVGGGHGQLTDGLVRNGYNVTILGSSVDCKRRIQNFIDKHLCSFDVGNILNLPYPDQSFDVVVSYRLLPHVRQWKRFLGELSRVAQKIVLVDYPSFRSINSLTPLLFRLKKRLEGNTRQFTSFWDSELREAFGLFGFTCTERYPQFFLPMVLHRMLKSPKLSSTLENTFRLSGATEVLGSPVILKLTRSRGVRK